MSFPVLGNLAPIRTATPAGLRQPDSRNCTHQSCNGAGRFSSAIDAVAITLKLRATQPNLAAGASANRCSVLPHQRSRACVVFKELARSFGATVKDVYWTLGQYDIAAIVDAPDDNVATALGLALGKSGNVRTQTLRAFSRTDMDAILGKVT
jgi:uncharacterized protein with GYD domain